jgi:hypothetical protein
MFTNYIQNKGYSYEQFVYNNLQLDKNNFDNVWFYKDVPENIIAKTSLYDTYELYSKYRNCDIGVDLVGIKNNIVYFIQCKNYDNTISINDLSSFYFLLYEFNLYGIVYYNGRLSERINDLSRGTVPFINMRFNNQLIDNRILRHIDKINKIYEPKNYQVDAYNVLRSQHRSILSFPCGMGQSSLLNLESKAF